jgi:hypothetical protein
VIPALLILSAAMRIRLHRSILRWLLPVLVLRALIPTGFMLEFADGRMSMVLCSGVVHTPGQHDHHGGSGSNAQSHQGGSLCPFAAALGVPALVAASMPIVLPAPVQALHSFAVPLDSPFGPERTQQSRAPPALA